MNNYCKVILIILLFSSVISNAQFEKEIIEAEVVTKDFLEVQKIPGLSISASYKGKIIWSEGFGYSDLENKKKVSPTSTQFRIASISKTLTSIALAKLLDNNKLDFDDSLYKHVPDFPEKKYDFSLRQIGSHLAGIRHYKGNEFLINKKMSIVQGLEIFKNSELLFKPGEKFKYSTYGWNLLSVVIQNASNEDFFKYMNDEVFNPLNMSNTTLDIADKENNNRTKFYINRKGKALIGPNVNNEFKAAGGGFLSTSEDLVLFGNEFINPKIISSKSLSEITTSNKTFDGKKTNYGIGVSISKTTNNTLKLSHSGGGIGASSYLLIYPEEEITIAILTNLSGVKMKGYIKNLENIFIK
ncbi:CubicO group peptidase (beta-lactamase class C family) [Tenacibaculum adriaticum]|uniref:CubicO group peptidase (Beta-lactamase class C family) n=1 Tax=Tenacibaculum adriaticum TaxID=413713 RepID=A0A5S5DM14_9FLAO|nr:serine hydrolase domain-containing protein [Tenacibaculum adriaticum]TYP96765.1 CubicO group peptidase (beta-lactamase class C family) [Tenacibaculum adriaticum]